MAAFQEDIASFERLDTQVLRVNRTKVRKVS
jgi:hypothetical protein